MENDIALPLSLVLNGVEYAVKDYPALQQFIAAVAKVEKNKLYTKFESLKKQIEELGKVQPAEPQAQKNGLDADSLVEKLKETFISKTDLQQVLPGIVREVVQPVLDATRQSKEEELKAYREQLIAANKDICIPDLVKGASKEELDKALAESVRLRAAYPTPSSVAFDGKKITDPLMQKQLSQIPPLTQQIPNPAAQAVPQAGTAQAATPQNLSLQNQTLQNPQMPQVPNRPSPFGQQQESVMKMPMSEYAKKREALMQQLQGLYGEGTL